MEYFELFDERNLPRWQQKPRPEVHRDGDWHRSSCVWVLNEKRELLVNHRHPDKDVFADLWDVSIAGHLRPGENFRESALREVQEELGYQPLSSELVFIDVWRMDGFDIQTRLYDREFAGVFCWKTDLPLSAFIPQEDEISELRYLPLEQVRKELQHPGTGLAYIPMETVFLDILERIAAME